MVDIKIMKTEFASPERADAGQLESEIAAAKKIPLLNELTYIVPDAFVILNQHRQIVYCNSTLLSLLNLESPDTIHGLRLGEALQCIHSQKTEGGCGTTQYCRQCGAVNAMVKSQADPGEIKEEPCRLTAGDDSLSFEFDIRAKTLEISGQTFTLVIARDTSHEKRRDTLERTFFHDILNTAGGLHGLIELMEDASADEMKEYITLAESSSETLVEEIHAQKDILAAESGKLEIEHSQVDSIDIIQSIIAVYKKHPVAAGKQITIAADTESISFISDPRLLIRVLGNMVKNGLEAEPHGQVLTVSARADGKNVEFRVHNPTVMPEEIKLQIFQRSFSTKGAGRGLGTYSIKLLGEKYLGGTVSFTSEPDHGTTFKIHLPILR